MKIIKYWLSATFESTKKIALKPTLVDTSRQLVFAKEGDNIATNERSVSDKF